MGTQLAETLDSFSSQRLETNARCEMRMRTGDLATRCAGGAPTADASKPKLKIFTNRQRCNGIQIYMQIYEYCLPNSLSLRKVTEFDHPHLISIGGLSCAPISKHASHCPRQSGTLARGNLQTKLDAPAVHHAPPHAHLRLCSIQLTH